MDKALVHHPIHHKQHGFTRGKGTESAISNAVDYVERHILKRQHCLGVFLDISSAFDSISASHIRQSLLKHGGDPEMVQWYYNYISHRDIEVEMHGQRAALSTGVGFPQGGVCSAKFWLIAFDTAIQIINTLYVEGIGYADDCGVLSGGSRLDHMVSRVQKVLDKLTAWGRTCGLRFNPDKSVAVFFTRSRKIPKIKLKLDGQDLEYKQEVRYLGVLLDQKLHWNAHINDRITKAKRMMAKVAAITWNNWGPKPKLMKWAYTGMIRPFIAYAAMIWGHRAQHIKGKLERLNRMAMNTFASFPRSTPTAALEVILDVLPLHLFCLKEGLSAKTRLWGVASLDWDGRHSRNKTHNISHLGYWEQTLATAGILYQDSDVCNVLSPSQRFHVNLDSFDGKRWHRTLTRTNVFTDGSRRQDRAGCGFYITDQKRRCLESGSYSLPSHSTVYQAELAAIARAVQALLLLPEADLKYVKIFVDSQAALRSVCCPTIQSQTVLDAVSWLNRLAEQPLVLPWCGFQPIGVFLETHKQMT